MIGNPTVFCSGLRKQNSTPSKVSKISDYLISVNAVRKVQAGASGLLASLNSCIVFRQKHNATARQAIKPRHSQEQCILIEGHIIQCLSRDHKMFTMVPCNISHDIVQGIHALNDKRCDSPHCKHRWLMLVTRSSLQARVESEERFKFRVEDGLED